MPVDVDEMLSEIETKSQKEHAFPSWLAENKAAADAFWDLMKRGYMERGLPFAHCMEAWRKHYPEAPKRVNQSIKRWVDTQIAKL